MGEIGIIAEPTQVGLLVRSTEPDGELGKARGTTPGRSLEREAPSPSSSLRTSRVLLAGASRSRVKVRSEREQCPKPPSDPVSALVLNCLLGCGKKGKGVC